MSAIIAYAKKDKCVRPSGVGYCDFGTGIDNLNFERTDAFSLYMWIRFTDAGAGIIFGRFGNASSGRGWWVAQVLGKLRFNLRNVFGGSPNNVQVETTSTFNDGKWHSVIVTYAGTSLASGVHIYVDGNDEALTTLNDSLSATTVGASFGTYSGYDPVQGAFVFLGDIGGLAAFTGALGSTPRATLHNGRKPLTTPDQIASVNAISGILRFWCMGTGSSGTTIRDDKTSGSSPGTLVSPATLQLYAPPYA